MNERKKKRKKFRRKHRTHKNERKKNMQTKKKETMQKTKFASHLNKLHVTYLTVCFFRSLVVHRSPELI